MEDKRLYNARHSTRKQICSINHDSSESSRDTQINHQHPFNSTGSSLGKKRCPSANISRGGDREKECDDKTNSSFSRPPRKNSNGYEIVASCIPSTHKSEELFSPPVKTFPKRGHSRTDQMMSHLPDYDEFQSYIDEMIYVPERRGFTDTGELFCYTSGL